MNYAPNISSDNFEGQKKFFIKMLISVAVALLTLLITSFILSREYCDNILKCSRVTNLCTHSIDRGIVDKLGLIKSSKKEIPVNSIKDTALDRYYMTGSRNSRGRYWYHISLLFNNGQEYTITSGGGEGEERANKLKATIDQFIHNKSLSDLRVQIEDKKTTEQTFLFIFGLTFVMDLLLFPILYLAIKTKQNNKQRQFSSTRRDVSSNDLKG